MSDAGDLQDTPANAAWDAPAAQRRLIAIDAARGLVMLFSCLAHFAWWIHVAYPSASSALSAIGMVATPSFLLISGSMIGLLAASVAGTQRLRQQLFNRGLFLLIVGHVLIALAEAHDRIDFIHKLKGSTIIDEIGLATLLAAFAIYYVRDERWARRIALGGAVVFVSCWILVLCWFPTIPGWMAVKQIFIGGSRSGDQLEIYTAPTLQYLAIYTLGFPIGQILAHTMSSAERRRRLARRTMLAGVTLCLGTMILHLGFNKMLAGSRSLLHENFEATLRITAKYPPSPSYLSFYAGGGLTLTGILLGLWELGADWSAATIRWLATLGRASFFVFVLQYFLYWTLPVWFGIAANHWCPLVFVVNVLLMHYAARVWLKINGNRWMTFGIVLSKRAVLGKRPAT